MSIDPLPDTIVELFQLRAAMSPDAVASRQIAAGGEWACTTWSEHYREAQQVCAAFRSLGLEKGDRLAVLARTRREWHIAEVAGLLAGAAIVGIDPQASAEQIHFVLEHAGVSSLVVDGSHQLAVVGEAMARLKFAIVIDAPADGTPGQGRAVHWNTLLCQADRAFAPPVEVHPDDPATLIYTAGTTGASKGIEYSHRKIMAGCKALAATYSALGEGEATLCWLPMAHLYQRMMNLLAVVYGMTIYFAERPQEVLSVTALAKPTLFFAVPRFYEKLAETLRQSPDSRLALRDIMGGNVRYAITGAAPVPLWVIECLWGAGLPLIEAYGVSENPVPIATNLPGDRRLGSVGKPFSANEIRLAEDGEVLVRGPALFSGYFRDEQIPLCFTDEGYYKTGDLGRFDEDGFLFLEGRKSELIKTSTGRRIAPARIEAVYGESPYLDRVVVCGNGRKHLVALVNLNIGAIAEILGTELACTADSAPKVRELILKEFEWRGEKLAPYERVKAFAILPEPLSVAEGELTPTLKLRRKQIENRHAMRIDRLYENERMPEGEGKQ